MILLCTFAHLCEGTHLQPLRLDFLSHPRSTLRIAIFRRHDNRKRGKSCRAHMSALRSPTCSPPRHRSPPHLPIIPIQVNIQDRTAPSIVAAHRWKNVSLASREIFSPCNHLVLPSAIAANRLDSSAAPPATPTNDPFLSEIRRTSGVGVIHEGESLKPLLESYLGGREQVRGGG